MIRKFEEARVSGSPEVELWGDGSPTCEFLYVSDAADAVLTAAELYADPDPINLGSGVGISIADLAVKSREVVGYTGRIRWDTSMPNGQPRRVLNVSRAKRAFGFEATTQLDEGLRRTVDWFRRSQGMARDAAGGPAA